jgi:hypothetical protein
VIKAESDAERLHEGDVSGDILAREPNYREKTVRFVREPMSNRLKDEQSAIVVIMQRLRRETAD